MIRLLWIAGGRDYDDERFMRSVSKPYAEDGWILITGAQRGADLLAEGLWREWECPYIGVPAKWTKIGRGAGPARNLIIGKFYQPDQLLYFPGGRGTANAIKVAKARGIETKEAEEAI